MWTASATVLFCRSNGRCSELGRRSTPHRTHFRTPECQVRSEDSLRVCFSANELSASVTSDRSSCTPGDRRVMVVAGVGECGGTAGCTMYDAFPM